mmetsp:Transcript_12077/g.54580  ORF Transcript_12077/g.54580 Transcript_12077/m.54580 type:complete len:211 (+) Transcript_12077:563-1195(+)
MRRRAVRSRRSSPRSSGWTRCGRRRRRRGSCIGTPPSTRSIPCSSGRWSSAGGEERRSRSGLRPRRRGQRPSASPRCRRLKPRRTPGLIVSSRRRRHARRDAPRPWTSTAHSPCSPRRCPGRWRRARSTRKIRGGTSAVKTQPRKSTREPLWRWWRTSRRCPRCRGRGRRTRTSRRIRGTLGISTTGSRVRVRRRAGVLIQRGRTSGRGT